jgi:hypothetical protein
MAILKGKDGTVSIANVSMGEVSSWTVTVEADTLETTAMGSGGWKTFVGSLQSWSGSVEMFVDDSLAMSGWITGADVAVILVDDARADTDPDVVGSQTGNTWTGTAVITSLAVDVGAADLVTVSLDLTGDGELELS